MSNVLRPFGHLIGDMSKDHRQAGGDPPSLEGGLLSRRAVHPPECPDFQIEHADLRPESRIVFHTDPHGPGADRFRRLRMRLRELESTDRCKSLLITSALPQDGKSTISLNVATALTERGKRSVLLIEADLYHPTLTQQLCLEPWPGLAECLEGHLDVLTAIRRVEPLGCNLLPAGEADGNPGELLQSDGLSVILQDLRCHFDWIVMDAPPLAPLADALALARHAQASLLVVRAGRTPTSDVDQAVALLGPNHVTGIVLNGLEGLDKRYSQYYGYSSYPERSHGKR